jgi:regulator of nucleoside diphosphate kinase
VKMQPRRMIVLTESTKTRLEHLLQSTKRFMRPEPADLNELEEALDAAQTIAPENIPSDVVTVNSTVRITDLDSKAENVFTLVFPREANYAQNKISVLAPVGAALLGHRPGDIVCPHVPGGRRRLKIEDVSYERGQQPAA